MEQQYNIYPIKGKEPRAYLLSLGCSLGPQIMNIPDSFTVVPISSSGVTYAVMRTSEKVFHMQYYPTNRWRVVLPLEHQVTFYELIRSYNVKDLWNAGVFGGYGVILQLMQGIPVQRPIVLATLERLSLYTGHPYDLENVKVALAEETREKERETNFA